jgi:hypothetical protein
MSDASTLIQPTEGMRVPRGNDRLMRDSDHCRKWADEIPPPSGRSPEMSRMADAEPGQQTWSVLYSCRRRVAFDDFGQLDIQQRRSQ